MTMSGDIEIIKLDTPVTIDGTQNIWVCQFQDGSVSYPASFMTDLGEPNSRWIGVDGYGETLIVEGEGSVLLVDQNGRIVRQLMVNGKENISLQGLSSGVYFVKVGETVKKVLVK